MSLAVAGLRAVAIALVPAALTRRQLVRSLR